MARERPLEASQRTHAPGEPHAVRGRREALRIDPLKTEQLSQFLGRRRILALLSDAEIASVSRAGTASRLLEGDEYVDLERIERGVCRVGEGAVPRRRVLARKTVTEVTWDDILTQLAEGQEERCLCGGGCDDGQAKRRVLRAARAKGENPASGPGEERAAGFEGNR